MPEFELPKGLDTEKFIESIRAKHGDEYAAKVVIAAQLSSKVIEAAMEQGVDAMTIVTLMWLTHNEAKEMAAKIIQSLLPDSGRGA